MSEQIKDHPVVTRDEWLAQRQALLEEEKELMRQKDRLTEKRQALPWMKLEKEYTFQGPDGPVTLADLFDGRSQLIVQHFMFGPDWEEGCVGCSFSADHVDPARIHFQQRDLSYAVISRAPMPKIATFKKRMGWKFSWVSSYESDFNYDFGVSFKPEQLGQEVFYNYRLEKCEIEELPGMSVFYKNEVGDIFQTYAVFGRGMEDIDGAYFFLDFAPKGRDEAHLENPTSWWRHHDRYETAGKGACCQSAAAEKPSDCCAS
ncbi:thioredoxin family protein [Prosthecobacter sp. SYSU 5D2]